MAKILTLNDLEDSIVHDIEFFNGSLWGTPRKGHPEGMVAYHINDVLYNIDLYYENDKDYEKLRLIALIHDTFKYMVDTTKPKHGNNHHGMYARNFAEKYIDDKDILDVIELHDEAYNSWQKFNRDANPTAAIKRCKNLIERLGTKERIELYLKFYKCDLTEGKKNDDYLWFLEQLKNEQII